MKAWKRGMGIVLILCALLVIASFFAKEFVFYDFHMEPSDYTYQRSDNPRPEGAASDIWFSYGTDRELQYGFTGGIEDGSLRFYATTSDGPKEVSLSDTEPLLQSFSGNFIAALPARELDVDDDGMAETVYDFARADLGPHAFDPFPVYFHLPEIPFELALFNRNSIQVSWEGQPLSGGEVEITSYDGTVSRYDVGEDGRIADLPVRDIRNGFTAAYSPDAETVYRMYFALEDYPYFSLRFWKAHLPLLLTLGLTALGIAAVQMIRTWRERRNPAAGIYGRERVGIYKSPLRTKTSSRFLLIRWLCLFAGMFLWTYAGRLIGQGQALNMVAVPVFSCPFNLDQVVETPCYYLSHLNLLFSRAGDGAPTFNLFYGITFLVTLLLCIVFLGRILCGFLCPAGLLQDLLDKLRELLHIRPIVVSERMNRILQPIKWVWIILFLGYTFTGGDFCDICPVKVFTTAQGGYWTSYYLGGFLAVIILVGSFFIKRFWCLICPMGYLMGLFHRFNLFKLKKGCTACTECGACYEACPMRLRNIYTERETEKIQTVDCLMCGECIHKCPEDNALEMTFCGKTIYKSSRKSFISKYAPKETEKAVGKGKINDE